MIFGFTKNNKKILVNKIVFILKVYENAKKALLILNELNSIFLLSSSRSKCIKYKLKIF